MNDIQIKVRKKFNIKKIYPRYISPKTTSQYYTYWHITYWYIKTTKMLKEKVNELGQCESGSCSIISSDRGFVHKLYD